MKQGKRETRATRATGRRLRKAALCAMIGVALWHGGGWAAPAPGALPQNPHDLSGVKLEQIVTNDNKMTITQNALKAILHWDSFDIGKDAHVHFAQNANMMALNRVRGGKMSEIYGRLTAGKLIDGQLSAGGSVLLINPQGVMFGQGAQVNVGGIVASARDITDADFNNLQDLADWSKFSGAGAATAEIENAGTISAEHYANLLGSSVINTGSVSAATKLQFVGDQIVIADAGQLTGPTELTAQKIQSGGAAHQIETTAAKTYTLLKNVAELQAMKLTGNYLLGQDIDAAATKTWPGGQGFEPVGSEYSRFQGTLDGMGYEIRDLYIRREQENVGLFGYTKNATIANVGLVGSNVTGKMQNTYVSIGGLVGQMNGGRIENSYSTGAVTAHADANAYMNAYAGGLVGRMVDGRIENSYSTGEVKANATANANAYAAAHAGGLVGHMEGGGIENSYSTSVVTANATAYAGGLVGMMYDGSIENSYSTGAVTAHAYAYAGGLIGYMAGGRIENSYSTGAVTAYANASASAYAGGLIGYMHADVAGGRIEDSYSTGTVTANANADAYAGGLVGYMDSYNSIENSYNTSAVTANANAYAYAGGLAGYMNGNEIKNSYNISVVTANAYGYAEAYAGGLVGYMDDYKSIENSYSTGAVTAKANGYTNAGGLVGYMYYGRIKNSYSTGAVTTDASANAGGLVGAVYDSVDITSSYWATDSSGAAAQTVGSDKALYGALGKTLRELRQPGTFVGWDLDEAGGQTKVWRIYAGHTTPLLKVFLTPLTATTNGDATVVYNGGGQLSPQTQFSDPLYDRDKVLSGAVDAADTPYAPGDVYYSGQDGYDLVFKGAGSLKIDRATAQVVTTGGAISTVYGDASLDYSGIGYRLEGLVDGETESTLGLQGPPQYRSDALLAGGKTNNAGDYAVQYAGGLTSKNYTFEAAASGNAKATVKKAPLDLTLNDVTMTYGQVKQHNGYRFGANGLVNGDDSSVVQLSWQNGALTGSSAGRVTNDVGQYDLTASDADMQNYDVTFHGSAKATVEKAPLDLVLNDVTMTYGQARQHNGYSFGAKGLVNGDDASAVQLDWYNAALTGSSEGRVTNDVGAYTLSADASAMRNYDVKFHDTRGGHQAKATVEKAALLFTADAQTIYPGQRFTVSGTAGGFVNGDAPLPYAFAADSACDGRTPGTYGVYGALAGGAGAGNYRAEQAAGNAAALRVSQEPPGYGEALAEVKSDSVRLRNFDLFAVEPAEKTVVFMSGGFAVEPRFRQWFVIDPLKAEKSKEKQADVG